MYRPLNQIWKKSIQFLDGKEFHPIVSFDQYIDWNVDLKQLDYFNVKIILNRVNKSTNWKKMI
jgi:hypothetical protein